MTEYITRLSMAMLFASPLALAAAEKAEAAQEFSALVAKGELEIRQAFGAAGTQALRGARFSGEGELEMPISRERKSGQDQVTYFSFRYRPAMALDGAYATLDLDGAVVGVRRLGRSRGLAEIVALPGDAADSAVSSNWIRTGVYAPVDPDGRIGSHIDLVARVDVSLGEWDLYVGRKLVLSGIAYQKGSGKVLARSVSESETSVADLEALDYNPLFEDENVDGVPDSFAAKHRVHDRSDEVPGKGVSLIELYRKAK